MRKPSAPPVEISDEEIASMQEKTEARVFELITARMRRFFGNNFEEKAQEVTKRTAIFRKNGAALLMIDGQPALEIEPPKWIPNADGVDCHIEFKEYDVNGETQFLNN
ncbi:conserved hypothetical protein [Vibrio phage 434O48-1]|nr:conserved hypothetical protein [Vibrio phage 434O48-1]